MNISVILLPLSFIALFLNLKEIFLSDKTSLLITKTILIFSSVILILTEFLSFFQKLNFTFLLISWFIFFTINIIRIYIKRKTILAICKIILDRLRSLFSKENHYTYKTILFSTLLLFLCLLFIQAVVYPTNNWDSMTYHMARIPHWISQESLSPFQTGIFRQIYQPPFAEIILCNLGILSKSDVLSNLVQYSYLIALVFVNISISELFNFSNHNKWFSTIFLITIPEVILQASSTQNDLVVSYFIFTAAFFAIKNIKKFNLWDSLYLGISIGLAIMTKGTAYVYLIPIVLLISLLTIYKLIKTRTAKWVAFGLVTAVLTVTLNFNNVIRNISYSDNIFGQDERETNGYVNEEMNAPLFLSNSLKNIGLHLSHYPIKKEFEFINIHIHKLLKVDVDNSHTNLGTKYFVWSNPFSEDIAPNSINLILIFIVVIILAFYHRKILAPPYLMLIWTFFIIGGIAVFFAVLKWQPWNTRLHTPFFVLSIPLIIYSFSLNKVLNLSKKIISIVLLVYASLVLVFNKSRPMIQLPSLLTNSYQDSYYEVRFKNYFNMRPYLYQDYAEIRKIIKIYKFKQVGLDLDEDDWEYPIFCDTYTDKITPVHLNITNISKKIKRENRTKIDCIISTRKKSNVITFKNALFKNLSPSNSYIWIYTRTNE
ncbi:MAG: 4-amino-4-deoxy-L-arabinose transferase-like glycosyltransferase [Psychroserpens sp.]|jgi:4-amino-4-deoxy-L-arabinose transferase-like glycosyltransferase